MLFIKTYRIFLLSLHIIHIYVYVIYTITIMNKYSQTPKEERIKILQSIMPEIFDEGKIDWEKLRATLGEDVNFADERYRLNWAGKSDAFHSMQEASTSTLIPCREESVDFDNTQNIFIEGENMEVLKVLQKSYFGKVKMIYIDPPYNTGNDSFIYPDRFSERRDEYMRRVGDKDENGYMLRDGMFRKNSKENGQYHSNWLNMMMPRLYLAKSLLREDGVIFVSIDDNEVHNLRLLMNEIFGEENHIGTIANVNNPKGRSDDKFIATAHESILVYAKHAEIVKWFGFEPDEEKIIKRYNKTDSDGKKYREIDLRKTGENDLREDRPNLFYYFFYNQSTGDFYPTREEEKRNGYISIRPLREDGKEGNWRWGLETAKSQISQLCPKFMPSRKIWGVMQKDFLENRSLVKPTTTWTYKDVNSERGTEDFINLGFDKRIFLKPKPVGTIKRSIVLGTETNDVILDFFAGSGTTAHAVMQLNQKDGGNRKYICIQLPEPCDENSEAGKAGYKTIADIAKERIRRAGAEIRTEIETGQKKNRLQLFDDAKQKKMPDLGFKVFKLADSNFKQWNKIRGSETEVWQQQVMELVDPVAEHATVDNMVYELLLKSGKDLNSTIEHEESWYAVNGKELILMLESATQETIDAILPLQPDKVIALDRLFESNDQLKTNTVLQMKDAGITFITI